MNRKCMTSSVAGLFLNWWFESRSHFGNFFEIETMSGQWQIQKFGKLHENMETGPGVSPAPSSNVSLLDLKAKEHSGSCLVLRLFHGVEYVATVLSIFAYFFMLKFFLAHLRCCTCFVIRSPTLFRSSSHLGTVKVPQRLQTRRRQSVHARPWLSANLVSKHNRHSLESSYNET